VFEEEEEIVNITNLQSPAISPMLPSHEFVETPISVFQINKVDNDQSAGAGSNVLEKRTKSSERRLRAERIKESRQTCKKALDMIEEVEKNSI